MGEDFFWLRGVKKEFIAVALATEGNGRLCKVEGQQRAGGDRGSEDKGKSRDKGRTGGFCGVLTF